MKTLNPQEVSRKWVRNTQAASGAYKDGVMAVTVAPSQAAVAGIDRMINKLIEMRDSGELARRIGATSLEDWKKACTEKGASRISQGVAQASGKMDKFYADFLPYVQSVVNNLPPRGDEEQNIQRMIANVRGIAAFKKS